MRQGPPTECGLEASKPLPEDRAEATKSPTTARPWEGSNVQARLILDERQGLRIGDPDPRVVTREGLLKETGAGIRLNVGERSVTGRRH